jgi:hypothetical protein
MRQAFILRSVVAILALFAASGICRANKASDTAASWGLLGTWQVTCGVPPNIKNLVLGWVVLENRLYYERNWGTGKDSPEATEATIMPDGSIVMTVTFDAERATRQFAFTKRDDDHIQAIWNRSVGGDYLVRDGKFVDSGEATPLQTRCH